MTMTAEMILTDFGSNLPLDRRRKDALATYVRGEAKRAGISPERWARDTFDLKDYEAKDLVRGNSSETVWEKIVKHPNGGWHIVLPVLGAVIGQGLGEFFVAQAQRAKDEAERARQAEAAYGQAALVAIRSFGPAVRDHDDRLGPGVADLLAMPESGDLGRREAGRPLAQSKTAPRQRR